MVAIYYKPTFVRQYRKLPTALQEEIKDKISLFVKNPYHPFLKTHKLQEKLKEFLSFSVNYQYRIIFKFETKNKASLLAVGDHSIYQ